MPAADALLDHARWVRAFARALVAEDSEDVAQDAWLAALQHGEASRPWFATVMRNVVRMRWRGATRRQLREQAAEPPAAALTPAQLAQRMELQTRLARAVLALEEPRRSTIVLVFYEGLSPAEIAREQAIPATTVRSRLRAALVELRRALDREDGQWRLALAPLVSIQAAPIAVPVAALAVLAVLTTAAIILLVAPGAPRRAPRLLAPPPVARVAMTPPPALPSLDAAAQAAIPDPTDEQIVPDAMFDQLGELLRFGTDHVDECYELARAAGREVEGAVDITIEVISWPEVIAKIDVNPGTTVTDPDTLQCIRENPAAIEEPMERLIDADDSFGGYDSWTISVQTMLPPDPKPPG